MAVSKLAAYIGTQLQRARAERGLTQAQVASAAKTNVNYYSKLERGESVPSLKVLEKIAKALKTKSSDILPF